ncbi:hypothetical protein GUY40_00275 [Pseudomonas sp. R5(2019)]|nr:hypothetical protein [Pseudomonas sp. R5(2019)]
MSVEPTPVDTRVNDQDSKPAIPAFSFPFKPAAFAAAKKQDQARYPGAGKSNHDKTPGRAPNGTRRSMGKR